MERRAANLRIGFHGTSDDNPFSLKWAAATTRSAQIVICGQFFGKSQIV